MVSEPTNRPPARAAPPLARYLMLLVAVAIVPLALVASALVWRQAEEQRRDVERAVRATATALSIAVDGQLAAYRLMLETLANSELIERGDLPAFHAYATRAVEAHGIVFIALFEPTGRHLLNTRLPFGTPLPDPFGLPVASDAATPPVADRSALERVFATGKPSNSDLFFSRTAEQLLFTVDVPVLRDGVLLYGLTVGLPPAVISDLLAAEGGRGARATVVDRRGFVVGRSVDAAKYTGVRMLPSADHLVGAGPHGAALVKADGERAFRGYARSAQTGWALVVAVDADQILREERRTWLILGTVAVLALLVALGLATWLARSLDRAIVRLSEAATGDMPPGRYGLASRELDRLRDALVAAKESRDQASRARESALREEARRIEAEIANRDKDRFMAAVVHELRTPLAALSNVAAVLKAERPHDPHAGVVQRQVGQLTRLVDDLLESARLRFGKFRLQSARIDLRAVVRQAVEAARMRHRDGAVTLQVALPAHPVDVEGDAARLTQVVANLVDNGLKFTPAGGEVRVDLRLEGPWAVLSVVDTGRGIDADYLPHIFDRFSQAAGTDGASEGLGLGLAVARDLVAAHKGRIEAKSEGAGRGTCFTVVLPLATALP